MVKQVDKLLAVTNPEVVPKVAPDAPKIVPETLVLNLFDIDPHIEPERPIHLDLGLDQLEGAEE